MEEIITDNKGIDSIKQKQSKQEEMQLLRGASQGGGGLGGSYVKGKES